MPKYVIRNQGFFYTDEYWAPTKTFRRIDKKTFDTKAAAEKACREHSRKWLRQSTIGDWVFDDNAADAAVRRYFASVWPDVEVPQWLSDLEIPDDATDAQLDGLIEAMHVTFVKVYELSSRPKDVSDDDDCEDIRYTP